MRAAQVMQLNTPKKIKNKKCKKERTVEEHLDKIEYNLENKAKLVDTKTIKTFIAFDFSLKNY